MAKKITTFGQIKVANKREGREPLILTFIDRDVMDDAARQLQREGFTILDESPGYQLFRDVEAAMDAVRVFCRD